MPGLSRCSSNSAATITSNLVFGRGIVSISSTSPLKRFPMPELLSISSALSLLSIPYTSFAMSMSLAVIFVSMIREYATVAWGLLLGDILLLSNTDILYLLVMSIVITFVSILLFREFLFISFDMETASAYGVRVNLYNMIMLVIVSVAVVVVLKGVGAILVYALLTIPPAAANEIAGSPSQVVTYAFVISLFSGFVGLAISFFVDVAPSGITGLVVTIIYVITVILRHGST